MRSKEWNLGLCQIRELFPIHICAAHLHKLASQEIWEMAAFFFWVCVLILIGTWTLWEKVHGSLIFMVKMPFFLRKNTKKQYTGVYRKTWSWHFESNHTSYNILTWTYYTSRTSVYHKLTNPFLSVSSTRSSTLCLFCQLCQFRQLARSRDWG